MNEQEKKQIKRALKKAHGHYFEDESLAWNITNFIYCSLHNHRYGRKFQAGDNVVLKYYEKVVNKYAGHNRKLLSMFRKVKHDKIKLHRENQILRSRIEKLEKEVKL